MGKDQHRSIERRRPSHVGTASRFVGPAALALKQRVAALLLLTISVGVPGGSVHAEEGMWTFDNPPLTQLREKYGFRPSAEWLEHLRLASVRFNDGGSGSFVSPGGLVITNHHVAAGQLQKLSTAQKDYVADGFYATRQHDELKCPDLELNVLISTENVTARVQAAVPIGAPAAEALEVRKKAIAGIERESYAATGLRSDVVPLYQSSEYWLYRYKVYTDCASSLRPNDRSHSSVATRTTLRILATIWTSPCYACTRTTGPSRAGTISNGRPQALAMMTWCSSPATQVRPIGSAPSRSSRQNLTSCTRSPSTSSRAVSACCVSTRRRARKRHARLRT
jgi:hypothetical protein